MNLTRVEQQCCCGIGGVFVSRACMRPSFSFLATNRIIRAERFRDLPCLVTVRFTSPARKQFATVILPRFNEAAIHSAEYPSLERISMFDFSCYVNGSS